jgi:hypothetical protein
MIVLMNWGGYARENQIFICVSEKIPNVLSIRIFVDFVGALLLDHKMQLLGFKIHLTGETAGGHGRLLRPLWRQILEMVRKGF